MDVRALVVCAVLLLVAARSGAQMQAVGDGGPGPVKAQHLTAELTSVGPAIAPGGRLEVGLVLTLEAGWHVFWNNAGDSGEPPKIVWTLPKGVTAGPMRFPIPKRLPQGELMDFGYEDSVGFPVEIAAAKGVAPGPIHLDAKVDWLVCREVCVPGRAHLGIDLEVRSNVPAPSGTPVGALGQALGLLPDPLPKGMRLTVKGGKTEFVFTLVTGERETDGEFYPLDPDQIANAEDQVSEPMANGLRLRVERAADPEHPDRPGPLPKEIRGLIKLSDEQVYAVTAPVVAGEATAEARPGKAGSAASKTTAIGGMGLAFLGGMLLNLMPCVFPVLFLKALALAQSSEEKRGRLRAHGLVYTLGILLSFWVIAGVLLVLRAGGREVGWGSQLQSPTFLAVLAMGLFLFSMSLAGQFELGLSVMSAGDALTRKQGYAEGFFTGVLATLVATPCTAPLMGAAIGFALVQPAGVTFAVFTALGLGLAFPYVLLTVQPAWMRLLPRPGAWMETLKQMTAVPLLLTVIWLTWVYGRLYSGTGVAAGQGSDHIARLLVGFLLLAIAGWVLAKRPALGGATMAAVVLGVAAFATALYAPKDRTLVWQPYTRAALDGARAAGQPVFIDFTAAWCLSCQVNERLVLKSAEVQREFSAHGVVLIKADWTQYDVAITQELASVGRSGVPTYVLYPAGAGSVAEVLPEWLTKKVVLGALRSDLERE